MGVNYRADADGAARVVADDRGRGRRARCALGADVGDSTPPRPMFAALEEQFGPVLVLVNNAGVRADGLSPQLVRRGLAARDRHQPVGAAFWTTRRALGPMLRARFGRIVNVASVVGPRANAGQSNYAASKAGLIGFTKTVAAEVARRGVTVNAVAPGFVETDFTADVPREVI